jgi:miniconductance mechanosensitive channel
MDSLYAQIPLQGVDTGETGLSLAWRLVLIVVIIIVAYVIDYLSAHFLVPTIKKITERTKIEWDDILLSEKVVRAFCNILPPLILTFALPFTMSGRLLEILLRCCSAYIIVIVCRFCCVVVSAIFDLFMAKKGVKAQTLKGVAQTIQVIICIFGAILLVSTLINKSPLVLITGLGAMAAVLMLVFQDSIKGLVAGIQLSANDMMRPGDWITLPKCNADGVVIDVTLNTVKVQNYDNTIITIPPYMLVNDSFQNWRGMQEGNGRRITRSVNIDMHSIRFLRPEELQRYQEQGLLPSTAQPGEVTNLQAYRAHLMRYLRLHSGVNSAMTLLVRQLAPTSEGLPLQVYCFSRSKVWAEYEGLQSEIVEYVAASLPQFGLGVYQRVGAYDDYLIGKETLKSEI